MAEKNNSRNPGSELYKRLTRLLSGPIVNRRVQMYRQQRRRDLDKYRFKSASGAQFKKSSLNPIEQISFGYFSGQNRGTRYSDFDEMEYVPEIASAMDIYADEMTTSSPISPLLKINCQNEEIRTILDSLYNNILNLEFNLFGWCRTMCKYGDFFLYLDIDESLGVKSAVGLPPQQIERMEGEDPTNPNYIQFQWNSGGLTFENWQIAHFRILGNDKYAPYGTSVLDPARRIWRQLTLVEDAMMAYRIVRSPDRRVFYIDVGNIAPQDVEQYMQKVMTQMKRNQVVDAKTGRVDLRYNPMSVEEDFFMPIRGETKSRIENLPGGSFTGDIDDVKYLRDKLFSALKIPQSYLSRGEGGEEDKTTLAQKDIRFARTIQRLQRSVIAELEKVGIIHLFTLGFRGDDLVSFNLALNNPSKIAEMQELEQWRVKFEVASSATEGYFSKRWVSTNLFGLTDDEIVRNQREMFYDKKFQTLLDSSVEGELGEEGEGTTMAGPIGGGDFGTAPDADTDDLPDADAPADDQDDDSVLLSTPEDENELGEIKTGQTYTKPNWKGKSYTKRGETKKTSGARRRSYKSQYNSEKASSTARNVWGAGSQELQQLATGGISRGIYESEEKETNYLQENRVLEINKEIKDLIEGLNRSKSLPQGDKPNDTENKE
tara:strand:+ start:82785 stop:84761 length:1977 start_codon:yes stop_codon:yes gene_type:complete